MTASRFCFPAIRCGPRVSSSTPRGVDLFLCECSFFREQPGMHVNYQTLTANLDRLRCKQLVLTHLGEEMLIA